VGDFTLSVKRNFSESEVKTLLEEADWGQGRLPAHITQQIESSDIVFSVRDGTQLAAFARVVTDFSYAVIVLDFIVGRAYQGKGVGSRLMKAILGHPDLLGIKKWIVFSPVNQEFFEQFNFEKSAEAMIRYG
jgi:N-acetylglutamate synthase-like GNAT family acetyltransferase